MTKFHPTLFITSQIFFTFRYLHNSLSRLNNYLSFSPNPKLRDQKYYEIANFCVFSDCWRSWSETRDAVSQSNQCIGRHERFPEWKDFAEIWQYKTFSSYNLLSGSICFTSDVLVYHCSSQLDFGIKQSTLPKARQDALWFLQTYCPVRIRLFSIRTSDVRLPPRYISNLTLPYPKRTLTTPPHVLDEYHNTYNIS